MKSITYKYKVGDTVKVKVSSFNGYSNYTVFVNGSPIEGNEFTMPEGDVSGVATLGPGVTVGDNAKIGPNAMVSNDVEGGAEVC